MGTTFSVAPGLHGTSIGSVFVGPQILMEAGFTTIQWELDIPLQADYENRANHAMSSLLVNGSASSSEWDGGPATNKAGQVDPPPAQQFDITDLDPGTILQVRITVTSPLPFLIGIANGSVS